jgi:hypothetical protein
VSVSDRLAVVVVHPFRRFRIGGLLLEDGHLRVDLGDQGGVRVRQLALERLLEQLVDQAPHHIQRIHVRVLSSAASGFPACAE